MIRREAFIEAGLFDESVQIVEDYPLYLRLALPSSTCLAEFLRSRLSLPPEQLVSR